MNFLSFIKQSNQLQQITFQKPVVNSSSVYVSSWKLSSIFSEYQARNGMYKNV